ncbi:MAG: ABC transporter ATP-binding protein [Verrucomicrobiota bacterium]
MAYIELKDVCVGYGSGTARTEVLDQINLTVEEGEFVAILGFSGTGKTTLMNLLAGLLKPDSGEVLVEGVPVEGPSPDRGLVFQNYSLLPWLNVYDNVGVAVEKIYKHEDAGTKRSLILNSIGQVNLSDAVKKRPGELSGGMRQRNSVARTLSAAPKILLLDEPLSALDALTRSVIQDQILKIWQDEGQTIILITNDVDEGLYMADRVIPLSIGPKACLGPETVVDAPRPRDRRAITSEAKFQQLRNEVINYLLDQKEKERQRSVQKPVSLPNIKPMDISRHRPNPFFGLRPKPKKDLTAA